MRRILAPLLFFAPAGAAFAQIFPATSAILNSPQVSTAAVSTAAAAAVWGTPLPMDRGPWVVSEVRFVGNKVLSTLALQNHVRAQHGTLYTPFDIKNDVYELKTLPEVLSVEPAIYATAEPAPPNYVPIAISSTMVRVVYTIQEKTLLLPGLAPPTTGQAPAKLPPASVSGVVLTPTAYRGLDRINQPGLGLDINAVYYIGRLYGKNSLDYTTRKTDYIDRLGVWLVSIDGKMQLQSEGDVRPAVAAGAQGIFHFRDSQPSLNTPAATVKVSQKTTREFSDGYVVVSKKIYGVRSSLGYMQGSAGDQVALLSEFLTPDALNLDGHPNQQAKSASVLFGSLLMLPKPQYPLAMEFVKPNGMALNPLLINFKLGYFLHLNFDVAYLRFNGGWDMLGLFQFRYTHFPRG